MNKLRGVTLIEVLVTVAIVAVLTKVAVPSIQGAIQSSQISSTTNTFLADLRRARTEAIRRGSNVVMCRSNEPEKATPACSKSTDPGSTGWVSGWIIFEDRNRNGDYDDGTDQLVRVQSAIAGIGSMVGGNDDQKIEFTAMGRPKNGAKTSYKIGAGDIAAERRRVVCLGTGGMGRVSKETTSCS